MARSGTPTPAAPPGRRERGFEPASRLMADRIRAAVASIPGLRVLGEGRYHLVALSADPAAAAPLDAFALGDALARRGWYLDRQGPPDSLHMTVSASNTKAVEAFVADLSAAAAEIGAGRAADRSTSYATLE